jgi:exopolysaccharide production protein ExoZ
LLLLPVASFNNSLNIPYWTLIFEVAFYATFSIVLLFSFDDETLSIGCVVWIALVMGLGNYFPSEAAAQAPGMFILLSPYTQLFALGVLTYLHQDWLARQDSRRLIAITVGALYLLNAFRIVPAGYVLLYGIACSCIVSLASRATHVPRFVRLFGDASYGIYLLHLPVLVVLARWLSETILAQHLLALWVVMATIALGISTAFGFVEFALHHRIAKRLSW